MLASVTRGYLEIKGSGSMMIPNFDLMLWIILVLWIINGIAGIISGIVWNNEDKTYGPSDVIMGIIILILAAWVILT